MFVCKRAFVTAWVFFTGYSMTDGCLLTDDVTFKAVISVPPPSSRLPAMRLFASLLLIIIPAETGHAQNYCTSRLLQIGIRGVPLTRVERKCFLSQSAGLAVLDLLVLLAVADVLVVSLPVILPVSERQGLAPCFISLSRRISWKKNLPDFETWAGIRHTWSLLPICCTCGRNKMLSVFCLFIDNCINFWEVCFLIWHSFGGFFLFCFCFFLIVFINLFPQKSASIYWKHLNTNKAKELKKKNHNRMKISTPAKIHKDETGCFIIQTGLRNIWIAKLLVSKAPAGVLHQTSVTYICNLFMFVSLPCTSLMTEVFVFSFRSSKRFPGAFLSFSFFHTFIFFFSCTGGKRRDVLP